MRQEAIKWWNELDANSKLIYWAAYCKDNFTPSLRPDELTGREVETIYNTAKS